MTVELENLYDQLTTETDQAEAPEQETEQPEEVQDTGEKTESTTPPVVDQEQKSEKFIPINALLDEREKRQRLEAEIADLRAKITPVNEEKGIDEDELFSNPAAVLKRVQEEAYLAARRDMINMSEAILFETKPDAQEKLDAFKGAVQANPSLYQQMIQSPNPAGFAYQVGQQYLQMKSMPTDMGKYEQELRAKIEAEMAAKYGVKGKVPSSIPTTLSDVPNVKPGADEAPDAWDIDSILKSARR